MSTDIHPDSIAAADDLVEDLKNRGHVGYERHRDLIALELYENGIWNGNYDSSVHFEDGLPGLRLIQEDEYDQSMAEDEKPSWGSMLCQVSDGYLWLLV